MHKIRVFCFLSSVLIALGASSLRAERAVPAPDLLDRDRTHEERLRWQASEDRAITPARVLRWMRGVRGAAIFAAATPAEFQPIVHADNTRLHVVGEIAFKFR